MHRDGDRLLQLLIFNEECLVSVSHQLALITSLPFVHTARRSYRLDGPVRFSDWRSGRGSPRPLCREVTQTLSSRGRRSRNKVSVGEPAEGSLPKIQIPTDVHRAVFCAAAGALSFARELRAAAVAPFSFHTRSTSRPRASAALRRAFAARRARLRSLRAQARTSKLRQLPTTNVLALATMKNAAKCDT